MLRGAAATEIENAFVAVCGLLAESWTWTVKLNVPVDVGIPLNTPVDEFRLMPGGKTPMRTDQFMYGGEPPEALSDPV
jgi:hypothetical protein